MKMKLEWEPNYQPRKMHTPGLGLKEFVFDVGQIVNNRSRSSKGQRRNNRKKTFPKNNSSKEVYHEPGVHGLGHMIDTIDSSYDSSTNSDQEGDDTHEINRSDNRGDPLSYMDHSVSRELILSDETVTMDEKADNDESSDRIELV